MEENFGLLLFLILLMISISLVYQFYKGILIEITKIFRIENNNLNRLLSVICTIGTIGLIYLYLSTIQSNLLDPPKLPPLSSPSPEYKIYGLDGKILINSPDTLKIFEASRVTIRIAKLNLKDKIFIRQIKHFHRDNLIIDTIQLSSAMKVNLKESPKENRLLMTRINNNNTQGIDTTKFSEWLFDIKPINYGKIKIIVSVSASIRTEFGYRENDYPVYEKDIEVIASRKEKFVMFWSTHYWVVLLGIIIFFLFLFKLIPNQSIIEIHMATENQTNFWNAGSLGLVIYIITIASIGVFKMLKISMYFVPLVFIGTILIYTIFTAVSLRDNNRLSEENFLKLMGIALKKIPPLNWIFKDNAA
jgi:hypothetical protein